MFHSFLNSFPFPVFFIFILCRLSASPILSILFQLVLLGPNNNCYNNNNEILENKNTKTNQIVFYTEEELTDSPPLDSAQLTFFSPLLNPIYAAALGRFPQQNRSPLGYGMAKCFHLNLSSFFLSSSCLSFYLRAIAQSGWELTNSSATRAMRRGQRSLNCHQWIIVGLFSFVAWKQFRWIC